MKKYLTITLAALVALASCTKSPVVEEFTNNNDSAVLTFTSKKPQFALETKTAWNAESRSIDWTQGDKISVGYTLGGNWMAKSSAADVDADPKVSPKFYASNQVTIDAEDPSVGTFQVPSSFDFVEAGKAVFYGVYPNSALGSNVDYAPSLSITIPIGQTPGNNTFDSAADIMVAKSGEITLTDAFPTDPIELDWTRIVAHADLTFTGLKDGGDETVSKITLTFNDEAKVAGSFYVDVTNGSVTSNVGSKNEIVLSGSNLSISEHSIKAWASLMPVTFTSLNVEIETNKAVYSRAISASRTFAKNARNTLTIKMADASRTEKTGQLVADGYYVISYGDYMMTVGTESDSYRGSADKNVDSPSNNAIWRINYNSTEDAYTILSFGTQKELRGATTNTSSLYIGGSAGTNLFTIEKSSTEATTYKIAPKGNTSRAIGYNISSPRFALYTGSTQQPITLDLTSITVDETPVITIDSEETTKTVAASATSVTFAYTANFFATTAPTVNVASDEDGIVNGNPTVADGTITVNLNANQDAIAKSATLTVSGTGIATPITLTINQEAKEGDVYAYTFTSKSWAATRDGNVENWTSGKDGNSYLNNGVQVTTGVSGANGTSPFSFTDISKIEITYCTNASTGVGTIKVTVGEGTNKTFSVTKPSSGGTTPKTATFTYSPKESGKVKIEVECTANSVFIIGASITAESINLPTSYAITCASGLENGSVEANAESAYEGQSVNLTATPATGYKLDSWNVYKTGDETTKVTVASDSFVMPAFDVTVSASFVVDDSGDDTESVVYTLTPANGSNNSYAGSCDITISGITWNLTGNSTTNPWRLGGKSITGVDRALYSKTPLSNNISKIEITHGDASSITVNSMTVIVSKNSDFSDPVSTLTPTFNANSTVTVNRPDGKDWSNCYYKIVYNVTVSGSSNKFIEFTEAKFTGK